MAAYVIAEIEITDPAVYEEYKNAVPATIEAYGGRYIVRGGRVDVLEGDWHPRRLVVVAFESLEKARQWWESEEYRGPKALRQGASSARLIAVEGLD